MKPVKGLVLVDPYFYVAVCTAVLHRVFDVSPGGQTSLSFNNIYIYIYDDNDNLGKKLNV